jgi:hypothetical protein
VLKFKEKDRQAQEKAKEQEDKSLRSVFVVVFK